MSLLSVIVADSKPNNNLHSSCNLSIYFVLLFFPDASAKMNFLEEIESDIKVVNESNKRMY